MMYVFTQMLMRTTQAGVPLGICSLEDAELPREDAGHPQEDADRLEGSGNQMAVMCLSICLLHTRKDSPLQAMRMTYATIT